MHSFYLRAHKHQVWSSKPIFSLFASATQTSTTEGLILKINLWTLDFFCSSLTFIGTLKRLYIYALGFNERDQSSSRTRLNLSIGCELSFHLPRYFLLGCNLLSL